jgi:hypothetical protein
MMASALRETEAVISVTRSAASLTSTVLAHARFREHVEHGGLGG